MSNVNGRVDPTLEYNGGQAVSNRRFFDYLSSLWESKWLIFGVTAFATAIGIFYAQIATSIYQADLLVQVEEPDVSSKSIVGDLAPLLGKAAATSAEIEIIRSRSVVGEAVRSLALTIDARPRYFPLIGEYLAKRSIFGSDGTGAIADPVFGLSSYAWGGEEIVVKKFVAPIDPAGATIWRVTAGKDGHYSLHNSKRVKVLEGIVGEPSSGGSVSILLTRLRARPGTEFVIAHRSELQAIKSLQSELSVVEKGRQSGIINVALAGDQAGRIAATLNTIGDAYVQFNADRKSAEAEKTLQFLDQQLPRLKTDLDSAEDRFNRYRIKSGTIDLSEEAKLTLQQSVDSGKNLSELGQKRLELIQRFTPEHPSVIAIDSQIGAITNEIAKLSGRISKLPSTQQDALRLTRDVTVNSELYTSLLNTAQQLRILRAGKMGNVRVVDYAVKAERPSQPQKSIVIGMAVTIGLFAAVLVAVGLNILTSGVESSDEIEQATGLPVLAAIPLSDTQRLLNDQRNVGGFANLLAVTSPQDLTIESLRSLRTALQFAMLEAPNNLIMVTGPAPEVGKSFVSANLAAVLALSGKSVLLIDCDLRRGHLHDFFGQTRSPGLSEIIGARSKIEDVIHKNVIPLLDFMSTGETMPNPAELLGSAYFATTLQSLAGKYDLVIVDTPPVLAVADAMIVGKFVGTTVLNLRHGRHAMAEILESIKRLQLGGVSVKGILLNAIPRRALGYGKYRYDGTYYNYDYKK